MFLTPTPSVMVVVWNTNTINGGVGVPTSRVLWARGVVFRWKIAKIRGVGVGVHHGIHAPSATLVSTFPQQSLLSTASLNFLKWQACACCACIHLELIYFFNLNHDLSCSIDDWVMISHEKSWYIVNNHDTRHDTHHDNSWWIMIKSKYAANVHTAQHGTAHWQKGQCVQALFYR